MPGTWGRAGMPKIDQTPPRLEAYPKLMAVPTGKQVVRHYFDTLSKAIQELNSARDAMLRAIFDPNPINPQILHENGTLLSEHLATCQEHLAGISTEIRKHPAA